MLISTFLNSLYEQTLKLGRSKFWLLVLGLIFLAVIFINGIGIVPEEPYQRLSENPFITRTDIHFRNNFQETLLLPLLAFYLRLTTPLTFNILCYVIIAGGYAVFTGYAYHRWGSLPAMTFST
ncbi:MAG TPA: hypothetical protein VLT51_12275, partial [Anaerolineales bacterium]|nr:hypothetical protein [Anaerolineales bacterium]